MNEDESRHVPSVVHIGGIDKAALLNALRMQNIRLNRAAEDLFADPRFTVMSSRLVVEITTRSVAQLGFLAGATYEQLIASAFESGLAECPLELGPHLRAQFLDQSDGAEGAAASQGRAPPGSLTVASRPLDANDDTPKGFYLRRIGGVLWLRGYWAPLGHVWSSEDVFVFSSRR